MNFYLYRSYSSPHVPGQADKARPGVTPGDRRFDLRLIPLWMSCGCAISGTPFLPLFLTMMPVEETS